MRASVSDGSLRIYASSRLDKRGCSSGLRYSVSHRTSHKNPVRPVTTKVHRQPYVSVSHGTVTAATSTPTFVPALKIPVASARSLRGNHSATVLMHAGKFPASPNPSAKRAKLKPVTVVTSAWAIAARLQNKTESEKP